MNKKTYHIELYISMIDKDACMGPFDQPTYKP